MIENSEDRALRGVEGAKRQQPFLLSFGNEEPKI
jgi:hypothetical protein